MIFVVRLCIDTLLYISTYIYPLHMFADAEKIIKSLPTYFPLFVNGMYYLFL